MTRDGAALLVLVVAIAAVFTTQRRNVGFEMGHHGWVSAHGLAIAEKAVPAAGFLGHSMRVEGRKGAARLIYFDRYPIFFSAFAHQVLDFGDPGLATRIFRARQLMNAVFAATMLAVYALLRIVGWTHWIALTATLLALSGTYFLSYKDMFHFDQPALLGIVLVWIGIATYERSGRRGVLYALALLAVCLGRGAASLGALLAWLGCQAAAAFRSRRREGALRAWARAFAPLESFRLLLLCAGVVAAFLVYNVLVESHLTGEPPAQTSIVGSAGRRLGFDAELDTQFTRELAWPRVLATQAERLLIAMTPAVFGVRVDPTQTGPAARLGLASGAVVVALLALALAALVVSAPRSGAGDSGDARLTALQQRMLVVMALTGPIWLLPLRRLAQFHDYTAMYWLGTVLAIDLLALLWVPRRWTTVAAALAFAFFVGGNLAVNRRDTPAARRANAETEDLQRVADALPPDARVHVEGGFTNLIPGVPFALGFYLPQATTIEELHRADYVLSRKRIAAGGLTPQNRSIFAYATARRASP
jgi:hypothetical protein